MKKLISLLLAVLMLFSLSPTRAPEETTRPEIPGETIAVLKYWAPEPM